MKTDAPEVTDNRALKPLGEHAFSIANQLRYGIVLFVVICLLLTARTLIEISSRAYRQQVTQLQVERSDAAATHIAMRVQQLQQRLADSALLFTLSPQSPGAQRQLLDQRRETDPVFAALVLYDSSGAIVARSPADADPVPLTADGGDAASMIRVGPEGSERFMLQHRFESGALVALVDMGVVELAMERIAVGESGYAYLVDDGGNLVAEYVGAGEALRASIAGLPEALAAPTPDGVTVAGRYLGARGTEVIGSRAAIPGTPWAIILEMPWAEAERPLQALNLVMGIALSVGTVVAIAFGFHFTSKIVKPLEQLTDAAIQISEGHLETRVELPEGHENEIGVLGRVFNQMSSRVEGLVEAGRESEQRYRQLFEQSQQTLRTTEALYGATRALIGSPDLPTLLQAVVNSIAEALPANRVALITFDLQHQVVTHFVRGGPGSEQVEQVSFDELWAGLTGWVIRERQPALSSKERPDPREGPSVQARRQASGCGAIIVLPLQYRDTLLGTLTAINQLEDRDFTEEDVALMTAMASQAVIAVENARLFAETRRRAQQQETLNAIMAAAATATRMPDLLATTLDATLKTLTVGRGGIWIGDQHVMLNLPDGMGIQLLRAAPSGVLDTARPIIVNSWDDTEPALRSAYGPVLAPLGIQTALAISIFGEHSRLGGLVLVDDAPRVWTAEEISLAEGIANQLGGAAERLRLLARTRDQTTQLQGILDTVPEGVVLLDEERRIVLANPTAQSFLPLLTQLGEQVRLKTLGGYPVTTLLSAEGNPSHEVTVEQPTRRVFEIASQPIELRTRTGGWVLLIRDITERKQAEIELRRQNAYLATLHATTLGLMNRLDLSDLFQRILAEAAHLLDTPHGYITLVEPTGEALVTEVGIGGFANRVGEWLRRGEGVAGTVWERGEPLAIDDYQLFARRVKHFNASPLRAGVGVPLTSGTTVVGVLGLARSDERHFDQGEVEFLRRFAQLASVALDNARLYTAAQQELSERIRVEAALRATEERYRLVLEALPDPIITYDTAGRITYLNPAFTHTFGWNRDEVLGHQLDFVPEGEAAAAQQAMARLRREGRLLGMETRRETKDGRVLDIQFSAALFADVAGDSAATIAILRDVTELKQAEAMAKAKEAAEAANQAKSTFLANMSHELRTPLTVIIGYTEILQEEAQEMAYHSLLPRLTKILTSATHLLTLINDILDLSKIEAGKMQLNYERIQLPNLIRDVVAMIQPLVARNRNQLEVICPDEVGWMQTDAVKVRQVLFNLLSNAAKFTEGGRISLTVSRSTTPPPLPIPHPEVGEWILFRVKDTGIGISPEQLTMLFKPFVQADTSTTRKYGGTGLGLTISQRFCQMMGGDIVVESETGHGSVFMVVLPAEGSELPAAAPMTAPALVATPLAGRAEDSL